MRIKELVLAPAYGCNQLKAMLPLEVERDEDDMGGPIEEGLLEPKDDLSLVVEQEPFIRQHRSDGVTAPTF